jgi:hypothetical protein
MRTIHKAAIASAVAFWSFAFVVIAGTAAQAGPIVPRGHYCMTWDIGGSDCSFTSYAQCLATASGVDAECYGKTVRDDEDLAGLSTLTRSALASDVGARNSDFRFAPISGHRRLDR